MQTTLLHKQYKYYKVGSIKLFNSITEDPVFLNLMEAVLRLFIFIVYIVGISRMKDIQRVFQYHGAEHKTIACFEAGEALTVENAMKHTRFHKRCGTSFLLIVKLGLYDSPLSQIIPAAFSIWNIILVRSYFRSIPDSLSEAAKIDGAGILQILVKIFVPLGKPIFAVIAVYTIVATWNSWFKAMLYLPHTDWQPLQMHLRRILVESTRTVTQAMDPAAAKEAAARELSNAQLQYAMIIFTTLPVLFAYPFFQRYFVKGMVMGSLKE